MPKAATRTVMDVNFAAADGTIFLRFVKQDEDGEQADLPHRVSLTPGCDTEGTMALVAGHLAQLGFPAISPVDLAQVRASVAAQHTPAAIAAFEAAQAATLAALPTG